MVESKWNKTEISKINTLLSEALKRIKISKKDLGKGPLTSTMLFPEKGSTAHGITVNDFQKMLENLEVDKEPNKPQGFITQLSKDGIIFEVYGFIEYRQIRYTVCIFCE